MFNSSKGGPTVSTNDAQNSVKEEDLANYSKIVEMLLAAGYFRVRIAVLTPFDKVVGGLCWCISNSNVDVDVDVSFQEDANIGQKIKVSEKIVRSLKRMGCPVKIQSFQIQGLDYAVIFQVLQWLIKKVFETRTENQERITRFSDLLFSKTYELPEDTKTRETLQKVLPYLDSVKGFSLPQRKFKRNIQGSNYTEWGMVQAVLLEYGMEFQTIEKKKEDETSGDKDDIKAKIGSALDGGKEDDDEDAEAEERKRQIQKIKQELTQQSGSDSISSSSLSKIVGLGSDSIQRSYEEYMDKMKLLQDEVMEQGQSEEMLHKRRVAGLKRQIDAQKKLFITLKTQHDEISEKLKTIQEEATKYKDYNTLIEKKTEEIEYQLRGDGLSKEDEIALAKLQRLVQLNESLKLQEAEFKKNCSKQLGELKEMISSLENAEQNTEELQSFLQIKKTFEGDKEKLKQVKLLQGRKNREVAIIQRKIDEIPTRTELTQYEKRFTELYDQVFSKLDENKKYINIYNTLSQTYTYMQKELELLNSIHDYFLKAKTKEYKVWMVNTVGKNLESVEKSRVLLERKMKDEISKREVVNQSATELITKQRNYYRALKQLQEEFKKSEELKRRLRVAKSAD